METRKGTGNLLRLLCHLRKNVNSFLSARIEEVGKPTLQYPLIKKAVIKHTQTDGHGEDGTAISTLFTKKKICI
jgi:hypothetical protein